MANVSYRRSGLVLMRGTAEEALVRDLQRHLRALGYLKSGIDGAFGPGTQRAVRALRYDLLHNDGRSTRGDGRAPVRVLDYNRGRVFRLGDEVDERLAACIADMLDDAGFPKLPFSTQPKQDNRRVVAEMKALPAGTAPVPFLMAMLTQESGLKQFNEPRGGDDDAFIVVGLDTNASEKFVITSRGYGAGQYTLFHHPPRTDEVSGLMLDVGRNLARAATELRDKFDGFVNGGTTGTRADDRRAEIGAGPLRLCKYAPGDARYMRDCKACARAAGKQDIVAGVTPVYAGAAARFEPTEYYRSASYSGVPVRANFPCDWPYAARRYNGAGINSYHYQTRVLRNLLSI